MLQELHKLDLKSYRERLAREKCVCFSHVQPHGTPLHGHDFLELSYITSGEVEHTLDGVVSYLREGDYLIVDYGSHHGYRNLGGEAFENIDCLFLPELLDPALKGSRTLRAVLEHYLLHFHMQSPVQNPAKIVFHDEDGRVLSLIRRIREELDAHAAGYGEMVRCLLVEILLLTVRHLEGVQSAMNANSLGGRVGAYVAEHYREPISLSGIARHMGYSIPYLSKCFKRETGVGFAEYLQTYRVTQACRLLSTTQYSIGVITEMVGYRDAKNLASLIKRTTGLSPSALRRMER